MYVCRKLDYHSFSFIFLLTMKRKYYDSDIMKPDADHRKASHQPMATHACLAASSFATFWLFPTPMPFSTPLTLQVVRTTYILWGKGTYWHTWLSKWVDAIGLAVKQDKKWCNSFVRPFGSQGPMSHSQVTKEVGVALLSVVPGQSYHTKSLGSSRHRWNSLWIVHRIQTGLVGQEIVEVVRVYPDQWVLISKIGQLRAHFCSTPRQGSYWSNKPFPSC